MRVVIIHRGVIIGSVLFCMMEVEALRCHTKGKRTLYRCVIIIIITLFNYSYGKDCCRSTLVFNNWEDVSVS